MTELQIRALIEGILVQLDLICASEDYQKTANNPQFHTRTGLSIHDAQDALLEVLEAISNFNPDKPANFMPTPLDIELIEDDKPF